MQLRYTDKYDWKKIVRMMRYLHVNTEIQITICTDRTNIFKWLVDVYHVVHPYCKVHMGANQ